MIRVDVKYHSGLSEFGKRLGAPLVEICQMTLEVVHARTLLGMGPDGPLKPLGYGSHSTGTRFWVAPGPSTPTPDGYLFEVESGPHKGWKVYRDYVTYCALHGRSRDLNESGDAWSKARIRVQSPTRATVAFYGSHRDGKGRAHPGAIMHAAMKHETRNLFALSSAELKQVRALVTQRITKDMHDAAVLGGHAFRAERRASALGRRISRLAR